MPVENLEEEGLAKNPNLELAQLKFRLGTSKYKSDEASKAKLMEAITTDSKIRFSDSVSLWFLSKTV